MLKKKIARFLYLSNVFKAERRVQEAVPVRMKCG